MDGRVGGWMDGSIDGWMDGRMGGWVGRLMDGWVDGWIDGWVGGRMVVISFLFVSFTTDVDGEGLGIVYIHFRHEKVNDLK
jgi:hypothetical protein